MKLKTKIFLFLFTGLSFVTKAQQTLSGRVTSGGEAIPYASIYIKNTRIGTASDGKGYYKIKDK